MSINLQGIIDELLLLRFEGVILAGALAVLIAGLQTKKEEIYQLVFGLCLLYSLFFVEIPEVPVLSFSEAVKMDAIGGLMKLLFASISIWVMFYPMSYRRSEHYFLLLSIILGSSMMLSANHLLLVYLCIELTSISSYLITGFGFSKKSYEAGIKYLLFGGVSSAIMLYGISLVYGITGQMSIAAMGGFIANSSPLFHVGIICILGGLFFKISMVPFHIWVPSTYESAPTDSVAILSIVPKIAGFVLLHRLMTGLNLDTIGWYNHLIALLGIATVLLGTFGALRQQHPKRLLAYGAIAHSGLLVAGLLIPGEPGGVAFVWYAVTYSVMNMAIFLLIAMHEGHGFSAIDDYKGIGLQKPFMGAVVLWVLVALIGLPPTGGFTAKFYLFSAMWNNYQHTGEMYMLIFLVVGILSVVFALFYYLKIPYESFITKGKKHPAFQFSNVSKILVTIFSIVLLWMFISPELLNKIAFNINFMDW